METDQGGGDEAPTAKGARPASVLSPAMAIGELQEARTFDDLFFHGILHQHPDDFALSSRTTTGDGAENRVMSHECE